MPGGRPTKYREEYAEQAATLCLLGATDAILAEFFSVSEQTVNNWKKAHPEFLGSLKNAKLRADLDVSVSLYHKAIGAEWVEEQAFKVKRVEYKNGKRELEVEEVKVVEVTRRAPPDTTAQIFWLKNRQPGAWRDKIDHDLRTPDGPLEIAVTRKVVKAPANRIAEHMNGANGDGKL